MYCNIYEYLSLQQYLRFLPNNEIHSFEINLQSKGQLRPSDFSYVISFPIFIIQIQFQIQCKIRNKIILKTRYFFDKTKVKNCESNIE